MTPLAGTILSLIAADRYLVGAHAAERLDERGIMEWQVIEAMPSARFLTDRPDGMPNPVAEFVLLLPDGTPIKAVWSLLAGSGVAKLVTVHYFEG